MRDPSLQISYRRVDCCESMAGVAKLTPFRPVGDGGNWRQNAVVQRRDDHELAMGFAETADIIVAHWVERGPNDLLFEPLIFNHRHALELVLKAAIRESAARVRAEGHQHPKLARDEVERWLTREASHNLHKLASRLNDLLLQLGEERLPADTHGVLMSLHQLDPNGEAFRYAKVKVGGKLVDAPRPLLSKASDLQAHVDIVSMHEHFRSAFSLLSGGLMTVLEAIADTQAEMAREVVDLCDE